MLRAFQSFDSEMMEQRLSGMAPLLVFVMLLFLQIALRFLPSRGSLKKRVSAQEAELLRQIKQLNRELMRSTRNIPIIIPTAFLFQFRVYCY